MKYFKPGFTLVEMILVTGILGILIVVLTQVFGSIIALRFKNEATSAMAQDSRYLIARLSYDVARASAITVPAVGDSGSLLSLLIGGRLYTYELSNGAVMLSVDGGPPSALTGVNTSLSSLSFTHYPDLGGKKMVNLDLVINSNIIAPSITSQSRHLITTLATR